MYRGAPEGPEKGLFWTLVRTYPVRIDNLSIWSQSITILIKMGFLNILGESISYFEAVPFYSTRITRKDTVVYSIPTTVSQWAHVPDAGRM